MNLITVLLIFSSFSVLADENLNDFYLRQVDYRKRLSISVAIPEIARIRLRPSVEFRYRTKEKVLLKCTQRNDCQEQKK